MIGIIAALDLELDMIKSALTDVTEEKAGGIVFYKGKYKNNSVVCAVCGMGKVFAAMCAEAMIIKYLPDLVINTGVAGSLCSDLKQLDSAVSEKCVQHDMDTSPLGDPVGMISGINKIYFDADIKAANQLITCYETKKPKLCTIATGDSFVSDLEKKKYIVDTFGASVCDMESGSIAHVCFANNTPFIISRVMSDGTEGDAAVDYYTLRGTAADISSKAVLTFIEKYGDQYAGI